MINVINHNITIDLANKINMIPNYQIKKNDNNSHKFVFTILNNSLAYDLTGQTAKIYFQKSDTNKVFLDCAIDDAVNGKLSSLLSTQCLSYAGVVATEITIYGSNGEILTSITFNFTVVNSIRDDAAIQSSSEFTALTNALVDINNVKSQLAEKATKTGLTNLLVRLAIDEQYIPHNTIYVAPNDVSTEVEIDVSKFRSAELTINGTYNCQGLVYLKTNDSKGDLYTQTDIGQNVTLTFDVSSLSSIYIQVKNADTVNSNTITSNILLIGLEV